MTVDVVGEITRAIEYPRRARLYESASRAGLSESLADDRRLGSALRGGPARKRTVDLGVDVDAGLLHILQYTTCHPLASCKAADALGGCR
jgi:hypothetical protein